MDEIKWRYVQNCLEALEAVFQLETYASFYVEFSEKRTSAKNWALLGVRNRPTAWFMFKALIINFLRSEVS